MRGAVSNSGPNPVGAAYRINGPVPAMYHEDPLFLELCAAFDELLGPFVVALDCFGAYLDPWLTPADFLGWLGAVVGARPVGREQASSPSRHLSTHEREQDRRAHIAGAVRAHRQRGTVEGLRAAAAAAAGVPDTQVTISECGLATWTDTQGAAIVPAFDPTVEITVAVPAGSDRAEVAAAVRSAAESGLPVFSQLQIKVVQS